MDKEVITFRGTSYEIETVEDCLTMVNSIIDNGLDNFMRDIAHNLRRDLEDYMKNNSNIDNDKEHIQMIKYSLEKMFSIILEDLAGNRYNIFEDIEMYLRGCFESDIDISVSLRDEPYDEFLDYNIIGNINNGIIFCDFDIYFAKTRNNEMYITEVGYEFE